MKGPNKPIRVMTFDGIDDYIQIDNSNNVGNPYDIEYNQPLTLVAKITPAPGIVVNGAQIFRKFIVGAGWILLIDSGYRLFFNIYQPTSSPRIVAANASYGLGANIPTYVFLSYDGGGNIHTGTILYFFTSSLVKTQVLPANTTPTNSPIITSTIKNTAKLAIGSEVSPGTFKGKIEHPSIWNIALGDAQVTDLASRMANDTVQGHALYSSNCKGYWREFLPGVKLINAVDQNYNGTLNGNMS